MVPLDAYLAVSAILFALGVIGVLTRRNIILILLSVEVMLNAVNLSFVAFSSARGDPGGQIAALFVIAIAASEIAVALAIAVLVFRKLGITDPNEMRLMKW